MNETEFYRVTIPTDAKNAERFRAKWDGKIVSKDYGCYWSLEGPQDEGVAIVAPDNCFRELTPEETVIAELLMATFWDRTEYTEDKEFLMKLQKGAK